MIKSLFDVVYKNDQAVFIVDCDIGMSVTNDAENVVEKLLTNYGNKRIIYRDTMGSWDELCHDGKKFTHYMSLQPDDQLYDIIIDHTNR
jgi:hypothetical protein